MIESEHAPILRDTHKEIYKCSDFIFEAEWLLEGTFFELVKSV